MSYNSLAEVIHCSHCFPSTYEFSPLLFLSLTMKWSTCNFSCSCDFLPNHNCSPETQSIRQTRIQTWPILETSACPTLYKIKDISASYISEPHSFFLLDQSRNENSTACFIFHLLWSRENWVILLHHFTYIWEKSPTMFNNKFMSEQQNN